MSPNDAYGMANSVDPGQTAPLGAVWSGSALFAQAYLSENLGSLRYYRVKRSIFVRETDTQAIVVILSWVDHQTRIIWAVSWQNQQNDLCA